MEPANKKPRRFNLFDIIIITLILLIAGGIYLVTHWDPSAGGEDLTVVHYQLELQNVPDSEVNLISVGDGLTVVSSGNSFGKVISIDITPYTIDSLNKEEQTVIAAELPGFSNVTLHIEAMAQVEDDRITVSSNEIRACNFFTVTNQDSIVSGYITGIER